MQPEVKGVSSPVSCLIWLANLDASLPHTLPQSVCSSLCQSFLSFPALEHPFSVEVNLNSYWTYKLTMSRPPSTPSHPCPLSVFWADLNTKTLLSRHVTSRDGAAVTLSSMAWSTLPFCLAVQEHPTRRLFWYLFLFGHEECSQKPSVLKSWFPVSGTFWSWTRTANWLEDQFIDEFTVKWTVGGGACSSSCCFLCFWSALR